MPASAGFWEDVMSQTYINSVSELPITTGTPEIKWQESGYIRAWIDIVGFRNLAGMEINIIFWEILRQKQLFNMMQLTYNMDILMA